MNKVANFESGDKLNDNRSTEELIQLALAQRELLEVNHYVEQVFCLSMIGSTPGLQKILVDFFLWKSLKDKNAYWDIVWVLRFRGSYEVLMAASRLCESKKPLSRELGVDILGQLGIPERSFPDSSAMIILKLLENEEDIDVLSSIGVAIGHLKDPRGVAPLVRFKDHQSADVRLSVVLGLLSQKDSLAINTLIELSVDEDEDIRNWATFGLAEMIETDTPAIRDALFQRVIMEKGETDTASEIRGEALLGLAYRKDDRVINPLIAELSCDCVGRLPVEAAKEIGDTRLYPVLIELQNWWDVDSNLLLEAIRSCQSERNFLWN